MTTIREALQQDDRMTLDGAPTEDPRYVAALKALKQALAQFPRTKLAEDFMADAGLFTVSAKLSAELQRIREGKRCPFSS